MGKIDLLISLGRWSGLLALAASLASAEPLGPSSRRTGVVLSEFLPQAADHAHAPFLELYNAEVTTLDLRGWRISGAWNFQFTNQTLLAPGAFLVVAPDPNRIRALHGITNVAGGFAAALAPENGRLRLRNRMQAVLLEVNLEALPPRPAGHSLVLASPSYGEADPRAWAPSARPGGSPGRPEPPAAAAPTPDRDLQPTGEIVLNEIMYHPPSGDAGQFVELFNPGAGPVKLGGWRLRGGIRFEFPADAVLPAHGYAVVARDPGRLRQDHPRLPAAVILGAFKGKLAHRGERLVLEKPGGAVVDEVTWRPGGRWGTWSAGGGSSLALRDPRADRRCADSWGDSDETNKGAWTTVEFTGQLIQGDGTDSRRLEVILCGAGEFLLDDVEVIVHGTNLVAEADAGFSRGQGHWVAQGNHEETAWQPAGGTSNSPCLHVRASGRGDYFFNRVRVDLSRAIPANTIATLRAKARWLRGEPDLVLRLTGNFLEAAGHLPIPTDLGTPGQANPQAVANLGPAISDVGHLPVLPAAGQPVTITARLSDPDGVQRVAVQWRIDQGLSATAEMALQDGRYAATLPGAEAGRLVAFRILAVDRRGATNFFPSPAPVYPGDPYGRECLVRFGEPQPALGERRFFTYHLWMTSAALAHWSRRGSAHNGPLPATFVYQDQRAVYFATARYSGSFNTRAATGSPLDSMNRSPLGGYNLTFPADDLVLGADEMALDANTRPGFAQHEQAALWVASELDLPTRHRRYVNVLLNGNLRAVFEDAQQPGGDLLKQWYPDDPGPELYKVEVWWQSTDFPLRGNYHNEPPLARYLRGEALNLARYRWTFQKRASRGAAHDYQQVFSLVTAVNTSGPAYAAAVAKAVDGEEWMRAMAFERIVGNHDSWGRHAPHNLYACKPQNSGWQLIPFDMDYSFYGGENPGSDLVDGAFSNDPILTRMLNHPPFLRAYLRALQDAIHGPLARDPKTGRLPKVDAFLDAHYEAISRINGLGAAELSPDYLGPGWGWSLRGWFAKRHEGIQTTLRRYGQPPFAADLLPPGRLRGTAPVEIHTILANGAPLEVSWLTVTTWEATLPAAARGKPLMLQGVNRLGQAVPEAQVKIRAPMAQSP